MLIMTSSFNDVKQTLRKKEFPQSARDALKKADETLRSISHGWGQNERHLDFVSELIAEFVFNENGERRAKRKQLTYTEELELMLTVLEHIEFEASHNSSQRNATFLLLFPLHKPHRSRFLVLLTSLALSCCSGLVLESAAVLLQQVGFSSGFSRHFALSLAEGYFMLVNRESRPVRELPVIAPLFTANFITALTEAYRHNGLREEPPLELTQMVVNWIRLSKMFVLSPLARKHETVLPPGSIPMPPMTPHAGLLRWWAMGWCSRQNEKLYLTLESLILETLDFCSDAFDGTNFSTIFTGNDIISIVMILAGNHALPPPSGLERFAVILKVILETKTLYINTQDFWKKLAKLPRNSSKLLDYIILQNMSY